MMNVGLVDSLSLCGMELAGADLDPLGPVEPTVLGESVGERHVQRIDDRIGG